MDDLRREPITIDLEGGRGLDPRAVADAIIAIETMVRSLEGHEPHSDLGLTGLSMGSAHMTIMAPASDVAHLRRGLRQLSNEAIIPQGWSRKGVHALVELGRVSKRHGVEEVNLQFISMHPIRIDSIVQENAEKALAPASVALGSARGVLYRYSNDQSKHRRSAALRDYRTGDAIELSFPAALATHFKRFLDAEVEVWGEVARDQEGKLLKLTADGIELLTPVGEQVTPESVTGLFGEEWTDGLDPVDWVRAQRD
ncbi:hypothetical protein [Nocardia sp. NPDC050718]|uniref:hypothetical protein n=1 Tax=Nocardia sp. NPDC050718 TaxID=3155788 RepID=UPI0033CF7026